MVKNGTRKTALVGLTFVVLVGLIIVYVPVSTEKIDVQCITAPCPQVIVTKTLIQMLTTPPEPELVACTLEFAPVCGIDGVTYSNTCHADVNNVMIVHQGECTGDEGMIMSDEPSTFCKIYPTASFCN